MSKLEVKQGGAAEAVAAARPASFDIKDASGRSLTLKKPHFLAQFNLVKALGDVPGNYISMVLPLLFLAEIDGEMAPKGTQREIDALLTRLDEHGYQALVEGIGKHFPAKSGPSEAEKAELKN